MGSEERIEGNKTLMGNHRSHSTLSAALRIQRPMDSSFHRVEMEVGIQKWRQSIFFPHQLNWVWPHHSSIHLCSTLPASGVKLTKPLGPILARHRHHHHYHGHQHSASLFPQHLPRRPSLISSLSTQRRRHHYQRLHAVWQLYIIRSADLSCADLS